MAAWHYSCSSFNQEKAMLHLLGHVFSDTLAIYVIQLRMVAKYFAGLGIRKYDGIADLRFTTTGLSGCMMILALASFLNTV